MTRPTADQLALRMLLNNDTKGLKALAVRVHEVTHGTIACPACGSTRSKDDNGARGDELVFLCLDCGEQFYP